MKDNSKEIGNLSLFKKGMIIATATMTTFAAMSANKAIFATESEQTENAPVLQYNAHVENIGWQGSKIGDILEGNSQIVSTVTVGTVGRSLRMEALTISLTGIPGASLKYNVHSENKGWTGWKQNGEIAGTVGESLRAEALKISVTGLNEAGYSLYYRVHVSNIGWMNWICADDSLNLENYAGTTGRSLRMEAIEIVLVKSTSTELGLKEQKEECIANLEKYVIALGTKAKEDPEKYNDIIKKINAAKETINKEETDTIEKVMEIYDNVVTEIKSNYGDIDKLVEDVEKAADEERRNALEFINICKEQLEKSNLIDSNKEIINSIIEKTEKAVNTAKTAPAIQETVKDMDEVLGIYKEYHLNIEKEVAKNTLSGYLDGASKSVKKAINNAIKEIDENIKSEEDLTDLVNTTTALVNHIIPAQKEAEEELKLYEEALKSDELEITEASKAIIKNEIEEIRNQIDNAEDVDDVTEAMKHFQDYMDAYYSNVVDEKGKVELDADIKKAIAKLDEYATCGYENVEKQATEAKKAITEAEGEDEIKAALAALDGKDGVLETLEKAKQEAIKEEETKQAAYNKKYKEAEEELKKYKDIVNNPSTLTATEVEELNNLIKNTEASLKKTTKTDEITEVMNVFEKYIEKYYANIETEADQFKFDRTKENAITTLSEYKDSKVPGVANKVKTAISQIEAIKIDEETKDIKAQITAIENALNTTMEFIELETARVNALAQLEEYKDNEVVKDLVTKAKQDIQAATTIEDVTEGAATTEGINTIIEKAIDSIEEAIEENKKATELGNAKTEAVAKLRKYLSDGNAEVVSTARKAINDIEACTSIEDVKDTKGVTTTLNEAIEAINTILGTEIKTDEEKLEETRQRALKTIEDYKAIADELGFTGLSSKLAVYENAINQPSNSIEDIEGIEAQVTTYITDNYPLLQQKSTAINNIKTTYLPETQAEDNNFKFKKYTEYTSVVEKAINDIKADTVKTNDDITTITTKFDTEIGNIIVSITAYETAQTKAIEDIRGAAKDATQKRVAETWVADVNKVKYADYLRYENDKEEGSTDTTTVFDQIVANATKDIAAVATVAGN